MFSFLPLVTGRGQMVPTIVMPVTDKGLMSYIFHGRGAMSGPTADLGPSGFNVCCEYTSGAQLRPYICERQEVVITKNKDGHSLKLHLQCDACVCAHSSICADT